MDLIDRQAVISEMKKMYDAAQKWLRDANETEIEARAQSCMSTLIEIKLRIEKMPSAEPEPHWIPVTKRLPDSDGRYLVTCNKIGAWVVDWNIWHCEPKPEWLWEQGVTAWMPMPEQWEGEEND